MTSVGSNTTVTTPTGPTQPAPAETAPTLSEREQLKIEFYKTYDVMTGIRIAATLGGFFTLMVLLVVYKSRCKSNKQLEDPRLTAAAEAAVAEAEAEERALAAALEAIARLPPKPHRGPRRSLCAEVVDPRMCLVAPRFASVSGGYDSLLGAASGRSSCSGPAGGGGRRPQHHRRCSSATCSSTASSYLERRGSAMVMPCLPPPPKFPRHKAYDEPWDYYHPIDIQVIQPTPELSPCGSEAGLYGSQQQYQQPNQHNHHVYPSSATGRRAPLASMGSVDPPEPDSRSLGSDSVFLESCRAPAAPARDDRPPDTEDEVSGFSTDSSDGGGNRAPPSRQRPRRFLRVPPKRRRPPDRSPVLSTTTSSSQNSVAAVAAAAGLLSPPPLESPAIELRHRPGLTQKTPATPAALPLISSPPAWSQETLF